MMSNLNKILTDLFEKDVMLCIRTDSPTFRKHGKQIRGRLNSLYDDAVKAIKINFNFNEREVPIEDIEFIVEDRFK